LYQIFRDNLALERELIRQNQNNDFILSMTSHMANEAFNRHVEFVKEYLPAAENGVEQLFRAMPSEEEIQKVARKLAADLFEVRKRFSVWVTKDIRVRVEPFEKALCKLDALGGRISSCDSGEERGTLVQMFFETLGRVGIAQENQKGAVVEECVVQLKEKLQAVLGISELTKLREIYMKKANQGQQNSPSRADRDSF
jgi:hypothetical protein